MGSLDVLTRHARAPFRGDQISSPEGWENLLCEVLRLTPELCRREKGDCRGVVRYTIYKETDSPTQPV